MTYQTLAVQHSHHVATIWLNRPDVRNAFNEIGIAEITQVFCDLAADENVRVIVLAARGPAFCAGADLHWMKKMASYTHDENRADAAKMAEMLRTIYVTPKPVLARVQGDCYAGGMGLLAACDVAVAVEDVSFCLSEVKLGLIPATIAPYVIQAMGKSAARRYFLTAEKFSAQEALRIGLVHEVVPAAGLDAKVGDIVKALLGVSQNAVKEAKRLVRDVADVEITDALIAETVERIAVMRASEEGRHGVRSFLEKRKPGWS